MPCYNYTTLYFFRLIFLIRHISLHTYCTFLQMTENTVESTFKSTWVRTLDVETESPVEGIVTGGLRNLRSLRFRFFINTRSKSRISGKIPEWLEGSLIRNGSGIFEIGETKMNHLFDGLSVIHRFAIHQGKASYQNRCKDY